MQKTETAITHRMTEDHIKFLIDHFTNQGWTCDINNETTLGFKKYIDQDFEWIRDYNKITGTVIVFNGKQKVNLASSMGNYGM